MSWIRTLSYEEADPRLRKLYDKVRGPNNKVDNVLLIHSLRPHTLTGHMTLYKSVLHNGNNTLPKWYLEAIGVYVSHLNKCNYCVSHHLEGLKRLIESDDKFQQIKKALADDLPETYFENKYLAGLRYARMLTLSHQHINEGDIVNLRSQEFTDGEILEVNQVSCYFNYVNRMVLGLGVDIKGDILGLSPNNSHEPTDWAHQ